MMEKKRKEKKENRGQRDNIMGQLLGLHYWVEYGGKTPPVTQPPRLLERTLENLYSK